MVQELNKNGERIVSSWLKSHGYHSVFKVEGSNFIAADSSVRKLLVQIKTSQTNIQSFAKQEIIDLLTASKPLYREAWGATLVIDNIGNLSGDILWYDFSKTTLP